MMRFNQFLSIVITSATSITAAARNINDANELKGGFDKWTSGSVCGCTILSELFPSNVHHFNSTIYSTEKNHYWNAGARLSPRCVFTPTTAELVAQGVVAARHCNSKFAVRGAGHMPVIGAANSEDGILFAMSSLNQLELSGSSPNGKTVHVGPGNNWGNVYTYLASHGLYAIGGRVSIVGVPGLILGGGINYLINKYGFAMDNVVSFEVVLASGAIVRANGTNEYRDLYWALKGGGAQFGIVTDFELKAHPIPKVWSRMSLFAAGPAGFADPVFDTFYSAITNLTNSGYTARGAGIISQIQFVPQGPGVPAPFIGGLGAFMHEGTERNPRIFAEFDQIPWIETPNLNLPPNITSPVVIADALAVVEPSDRHLFHVEASVGSLDAVKTMHNVLESHVSKLVKTVPSSAGVGIAIQGIPKSAIEVGQSDAKKLKGNSFGLKPGESQFWYCLAMSWSAAVDDVAAEAWAKEFGEKLVKALGKKRLLSNDGRGFVYMNDAQKGQDVFKTYGPKELKALKAIREKYDPQGRVFGNQGLMNGGFKF